MLRIIVLVAFFVASAFGCARRPHERVHEAPRATTVGTPAPVEPVPVPLGWRPIPGGPNAPTAREYAIVRQVGDELVVWGGLLDAREPGWHETSIARPNASSAPAVAAGAILNLRTGAWRTMATSGQPTRGWVMSRMPTWPLVLTPAHRAMVVCTSLLERRERYTPGVSVSQCARYDLDEDRWSPVAVPPIQPLVSGCAVIEDGEAIVCLAGHETMPGAEREKTMIYEVARDRWIDAGPLQPAQVCSPSTGDCWYVLNRVVTAGRTARAYAVRTSRSNQPEAAEFELTRTAPSTYAWRLVADWHVQHWNAADRGWPVRVGQSTFLIAFEDYYGTNCDHGSERGCTNGFQVQRVRDGVSECRTVVTRSGPSLAPFDQGVHPHCDPWPSRDGFVCSGERFRYDNTRFRFRELQSWAFACSWGGSEPTCWRVTEEGQPSFRRHAALEFTGEDLVVWGGRSTSLASDVCLGPRTMCGMTIDGPLLSDGAMLRVAPSIPALITPCHCTEDATCDPPDDLPGAVP